MRFLLLLVSIPFFSAWALSVDVPLADAQQEARAQELFTQVRCVVCQGQSLADSSAEVATDMRRTIRKLIVAGKQDAEILNYLSQRYGHAIRMRPLFSLVPGLWLAPIGFLLAALVMAALYFRRQRS